MTIFRTALAPIRSWSVSSQQRARRNAMVQLNALTAVRAQRTEVEEFLAAALAPTVLPLRHAGHA